MTPPSHTIPLSSSIISKSLQCKLMLRGVRQKDQTVANLAIEIKF